jgi:DNA-binding GntR family transcriptional regulator
VADVAPIDVRRLSESHFLRVAVETEVVRQLANQVDQGSLKRSRRILQMQRALMEAAIRGPYSLISTAIFIVACSRLLAWNRCIKY